MRLWNKWTLAIEGRRRWVEQYGGRPNLLHIVQSLEDLGAHPDPDQLYEASGRRIPRGEIKCDECGEEDPEGEVVELGEMIEVDYESNRVNICLKCLMKALQLIDQ